MLKLGADVGGTFTDLYAVDDTTNKVYIGKRLTTPGSTEGLINAFNATGLKWKEVDVFVYGTTIATNSILTRSYYGWWPKAAFIATKGFRDTLEIRRARNMHVIDMYARAAIPLIGRRSRFEISEKIDRNGEVIEKVDETAIKELAQRLKALQIESVGICFNNAYANPENERKAKVLLQKELPGVPISISTDIAPKFRELPRMVTTALRTLLIPIISDYMDKLEKNLEEFGFRGTLLIVKGDGGTATVEVIKECPELIMQSGPAAGAFAGLVCGETLGVKNALTQDMGGTSYDVCIIENGKYLTTSEYEVDFDMPLSIPMTDVRSIGTGGGSIIWIDEGGSLRVGPLSSGAKPGPVCYGNGGELPTITDANLILGRIDKTLGGKTELDLDNARKIFEKRIADPLGISVETAAEGALKVSCANMARANSVVTTSRGRDPRQFIPIVFGGAGSMHICSIAEELSIKEAAIPIMSGVASAMGAVMMPIRVSLERTMQMELNKADLGKINSTLAMMKNEVLSGLKRQGVDINNINLSIELDMRYVGQNYEVTVPVQGDSDFDKQQLKTIQNDFHQIHKKEYFTNNPEFGVAIVNVRVIGVGQNASVSLPTFPEATYAVKKAIKARRPVYFEGEFFDTPVYDVEKLMNGHELSGPAIIEMPESCVVVNPHWSATVDMYKNIRLLHGGK